MPTVSQLTAGRGHFTELSASFAAVLKIKQVQQQGDLSH
jgi:hypothetical protein